MPSHPSLAERFHQATVYTPERLAQGSGLDLSAQPSPFKDWYQAQAQALAGGPRGPWEAAPGRMDASRLGRLLFHTYGVTRVSQQPGQVFHMRASPSAGGLYPSELYVATRGVTGLADGLHDYLPREHALALCWEGDFLTELKRYTFDSPALVDAPVALIATGVWQRSAWRYGDRAYRRVLLDTGHMLENAVLAAPAEGHRVVPLPGFHDDAVDGLLLLDPSREATLMVAAVRPGADLPPGREAPRSAVRRDEPSPAPGGWIRAVHDAGRLSAYAEPLPMLSAGEPVAIGPEVELPGQPLAGGGALLEAIRRRRSTRVFRPESVPLTAMGCVLAHADPAQRAGIASTLPAPDLLTTWVVVAGVDGCVPGIYRYAPQRHALALVRAGDARQALFGCCLQQELARDAAFTVVHTFDLPASITRYGERAYRYAHLAAGMVGERLSLAALRTGLGASGIGGFLDEVLGGLLLLPEHHAVAYLTVFGVPARGPGAG